MSQAIESGGRSFMIPEDHPALAGHFPGNPVVPGVVILDKVREVISQQLPGQRVEALPAVKFHAPLFAMQNFNIQLQLKNNRYQFRCEREGDLLAQGDILLAQV